MYKNSLIMYKIRMRIYCDFYDLSARILQFLRSHCTSHRWHFPDLFSSNTPPLGLFSHLQSASTSPATYSSVCPPYLPNKDSHGIFQHFSKGLCYYTDIQRCASKSVLRVDMRLNQLTCKSS